MEQKRRLMNASGWVFVVAGCVSSCRTLGPTNDLDPADGVDDRTFRSNAWPVEADGSGRTIELRHPRLGNRAGIAWLASLASREEDGTARRGEFELRGKPASRDSRRHR